MWTWIFLAAIISVYCWRAFLPLNIFWSVTAAFLICTNLLFCNAILITDWINTVLLNNLSSLLAYKHFKFGLKNNLPSKLCREIEQWQCCSSAAWICSSVVSFYTKTVATQQLSSFHRISSWITSKHIKLLVGNYLSKWLLIIDWSTVACFNLLNWFIANFILYKDCTTTAALFNFMNFIFCTKPLKQLWIFTAAFLDSR